MFLLFVKFCVIEGTPFTLEVGDIKNVEQFEISGCGKFYCQLTERTDTNITIKLTMRKYLKYYYLFLGETFFINCL